MYLGLSAQSESGVCSRDSEMIWSSLLKGSLRPATLVHSTPSVRQGSTLQHSPMYALYLIVECNVKRELACESTSLTWKSCVLSTGGCKVVAGWLLAVPYTSRVNSPRSSCKSVPRPCTPRQPYQEDRTNPNLDTSVKFAHVKSQHIAQAHTFFRFVAVYLRIEILTNVRSWGFTISD